MIIFGRGKLTATDVFGHGDEVLDIVDRFKYLGVKFSKLGNFAKCKKNPCDKASKAMSSPIQTARKKDLHVILDLFDNMVISVLFYGCEVWGYEK